jgi:tRNA(Ile)-lysidine synthase
MVGGRCAISQRMSSASDCVPGEVQLRAALEVLPRVPLVLAVSGGLDSMALLHAAARWIPERVAIVATFDHGTGMAARAAAALVVAEARRRGLAVARQRALRPASTEAGWREARWAFLDRVAAAHRASVVTAHTADDQLETIVQRWLRGAGARGLAALAAPGPRLRPWLALPRAVVRAWAEGEGIPSVEDPANCDRRHQRVRLRLDLLPLLERADPGFRDGLLAVGARAAAWRADVEALVATLPWRARHPGVWALDRAAVRGWSPEALSVLWPALLAPLGVLLSADGTRRLVRFTGNEDSAGELQLDGGVTVVRTNSTWEVRSAAVSASVAAARAAESVLGVGGEPLSWPGWRIVPVHGRAPGSAGDPRTAPIRRGASLVIRRWHPGDRIRCDPAGASRRVSRYLAERGVPRRDRLGWPVILDAGEIVWVPGVCRGGAAPSRSGRSDFIWYRSERDFG